MNRACLLLLIGLIITVLFAGCKKVEEPKISETRVLIAGMKRTDIPDGQHRSYSIYVRLNGTVYEKVVTESFYDSCRNIEELTARFVTEEGKVHIIELKKE